MTDLEFDILDELYFVTSFAELLPKFDISQENLKLNLLQMIEKGWVNYYVELDGAANQMLPSIDQQICMLFFLASKQGLFAHNTK